MIDLKTRFPTIDENAVSDFETKIIARLPGDYRQFLLCCNGGQPVDAAFNVEGWGSSCVQYFYGLNTGSNAYDLVWAGALFARIFPDSVIPIGCDPDGCVICLGVRRTAVGKVYFWHRGERLEQFIQVAPSFERFLSSLGPSQ